MNKKYFLSQDQSCHWYIIPADKEKEWMEFNDLSEDDECSWNVPEWAVEVGGSPTRVKFENFVIE